MDISAYIWASSNFTGKHLHDYPTQSILAGGGVKQGGKPTNHPSELLKWGETAAICNIVEKIYLNMKANSSN